MTHYTVAATRLLVFQDLWDAECLDPESSQHGANNHKQEVYQVRKFILGIQSRVRKVIRNFENGVRYSSDQESSKL